MSVPREADVKKRVLSAILLCLLTGYRSSVDSRSPCYADTLADADIYGCPYTFPGADEHCAGARVDRPGGAAAGHVAGAR